MSKAAQRKRAAYALGYRQGIGRTLPGEGHKTFFRFRSTPVAREYDRGLKAGSRARREIRRPGADGLLARLRRWLGLTP